MMKEVKWNDQFNIGVESIDKAHHKLFSIVGKLINLNETEAKQEHACREGVKYFKSYTIQHFADEEAYMQSIGYSGYAVHKRLHDDLRDKTLPALEAELEKRNYSPEAVQHFVGICVGWLNGHIMIEDRAITGRTSNKWVIQPSDNELTSLEKASIQTLQRLFRVQPQVISEHYGGEVFSLGNTLCYRLNYRNQKGELLQAYLTYEERLILQILGELLGKQISHADKTVIYAMKMLSQQFMALIKKQFELPDEYQLEKNDLLTFDQLLRTFEKEYPPYSLLFSTDGKGYFAFCIRGQHLIPSQNKQTE